MENYRKVLLIPQVIMIGFIIFLSLFSFDVWGEDWTIGEKLLGFIIHLLPSLILLVVLFFTSRYTRICGYIFLFMGLSFMFFFDAYDEVLSFLVLVCPLLVTGLLLLLADRMKADQE